MLSELRIVETMSGGCVIVGLKCDRDRPGQWSYVGPVDPFNPFMTRGRAEKELEHMQQLESMSLLA